MTWDPMLCEDCGFDTVPERKHHSQEYYMVTDGIWSQAGDVHGLLCIGCLEQRLGRQLKRCDFAQVRINEDSIWHTSRLRDRLGYA